MKYYWINLDSAEKRRENILKEFAENNVEHVRIPAYTPFSGTGINNADDKFFLENACVRSHVQAIFHFLMNSTDPYGLICEDDLTFDLKEFWRKSVEDVVENSPNDCGILQLAVITQHPGKMKDKTEYFKYSEFKCSSCLAYVIKRNCAEQLLKFYMEHYSLIDYKNKRLNPRGFAKADCGQNGVYMKVNKHTDFTAYTYKYPMFCYPKENNSQLDNNLRLHEASRRHLIQYLKVSKND